MNIPIARRTAAIVLLVLLALAGIVHLRPDLISGLPRVRPADFALQDHSWNDLPQIEQTFTVSATTCQYRMIREGQIEEFTDCEMSAAELDALYQIVRANAFDRIGPTVPITCSWSYSDDLYWKDMGMTANGTIYYQRPLNCALTFGESRYAQVSGALYRLQEQKISIRQTDLVTYFRTGATPAKIDNFRTDLYLHQRGIVCAVRSSLPVDSHGGFAINFCPHSEPAARAAVVASIQASPLVERVFEHVDPASITTLAP